LPSAAGAAAYGLYPAEIAAAICCICAGFIPPKELGACCACCACMAAIAGPIMAIMLAQLGAPAAAAGGKNPGGAEEVVGAALDAGWAPFVTDVAGGCSVALGYAGALPALADMAAGAGPESGTEARGDPGLLYGLAKGFTPPYLAAIAAANACCAAAAACCCCCSALGC